MHSYFADTTVHYKCYLIKVRLYKKTMRKRLFILTWFYMHFFLSVYTIFLRIFKVKLVSLLPAISFLYKIRKQFRS